MCVCIYYGQKVLILGMGVNTNKNVHFWLAQRACLSQAPSTRNAVFEAHIKMLLDMFPLWDGHWVFSKSTYRITGYYWKFTWTGTSLGRPVHTTKSHFASTRKLRLLICELGKEDIANWPELSAAPGEKEFLGIDLLESLTGLGWKGKIVQLQPLCHW